MRLHQSLVDLYWSKEFFLNISAEALGVLFEVVLIIIIIGRYLDRKEACRWNNAFAARIKKLLEVHRDMPVALEKMAMVHDLTIFFKISIWSENAQERLRDALALVPPKLTAPQYIAAENYLEAIRDLSHKFMNQEMPLSVLEALNERARALAVATEQASPTDYLWTQDFLTSLGQQLNEDKW